jgi:putative peptide maturation dehydrogenase
MKVLAALASDDWEALDEVRARYEVSSDDVIRLARAGLVITDADEGALADFRMREEATVATEWNKYALLYHSLAKWRGVSVTIPGDGEDELLRKLLTERDDRYRFFIERNGKPPLHFHEIKNPIRRRELPLIRRDGEFYRVLTSRRTVREFDQSTPVLEDDFSSLLYYVWGCHGYLPLFEDVVGLKKTSPSGGDLHPIEVYPVVSNVEGLETGIYHYNVERHSVDLVRQLAPDAVESCAQRFVAGQTYFSSAHVLFVMTARFGRNYWKYRGHPRAYGVLLMDAAHLSQTFYLVATELGLGPFVTAAINGSDIEEDLGLDGVSEGAIAICGCGVPARGTRSLEAEVLDLSPEYLPYTPRVTDIRAGRDSDGKRP